MSQDSVELARRVNEVTQVLRFRDGRVIHATGYRDRAKALASVGLS